jgi:hypothetical protein
MNTQNVSFRQSMEGRVRDYEGRGEKGGTVRVSRTDVTRMWNDGQSGKVEGNAEWRPSLPKLYLR